MRDNLNTNMDNMQISNKINDINLFFEIIGFDETTKADHLGRIMTIILAAVSKKLDMFTALKEKAVFPKMESFKDFYDYYERYTDRATIDKIIEEETHKVFAGYLEEIASQLSK